MTSALAVGATLTSDAPTLHILFRIGDTEFVLPAERVVQMETFSRATRVPGVPDYVIGIVQLRGRMIPVVDLRVRMGMPRAAVTLDSRVIVSERDGRPVALLVDYAREVVRIAPSQRQPPPALMEGATTRFVESIVQIGDRTILVLDFEKAIGEGASHVVE
jgi:purine-binding chemotaxis protein CheW